MEKSTLPSNHHLAPPGYTSHCGYCGQDMVFSSLTERKDHHATCVWSKIGAALHRIRAEMEGQGDADRLGEWN